MFHHKVPCRVTDPLVLSFIQRCFLNSYHMPGTVYMLEVQPKLSSQDLIDSAGKQTGTQAITTVCGE